MGWIYLSACRFGALKQRSVSCITVKLLRILVVNARHDLYGSKPSEHETRATQTVQAVCRTRCPMFYCLRPEMENLY